MAPGAQFAQSFNFECRQDELLDETVTARSALKKGAHNNFSLLFGQLQFNFKYDFNTVCFY